LKTTGFEANEIFAVKVQTGLCCADATIKPANLAKKRRGLGNDVAALAGRGPGSGRKTA
jgi:hypothetical protein